MSVRKVQLTKFMKMARKLENHCSFRRKVCTTTVLGVVRERRAKQGLSDISKHVSAAHGTPQPCPQSQTSRPTRAKLLHTLAPTATCCPLMTESAGFVSKSFSHLTAAFGLKFFLRSAMTTSFISNLGFVHTLNVMLLVLTALSWSSPIKPSEIYHKTRIDRSDVDDDTLNAQDFLTHFISTLNLTKRTSQTSAQATHTEPLPEFMLELYYRFANDRTAVPSANIVRSFKNEDFSPSRVKARGVRIHPLLFNISVPHHEHITIAELRLFILVQKAQIPYAGINCKVTIYMLHDGVIWTKEVGKEGRGRDKEEVVEMNDLQELMTKHIRAKDNSWVSFDLTHVVTLWWKSGCATRRLEVHIESLGSEEEEVMQKTAGRGDGLIEIDIDRNLEGTHNSMMIVFSDDQSRDHKRDRQELGQMIQHENDLPQNMDWSQQLFRGDMNHNTDRANQDELGEQSALDLQSNLIYDTPPRIRRNVKSESCRRTPLFVDFKDIGWDKWIVQPLGYEAYKCNGVCSPPMTSEVSPTKHAIVQTRLSLKSPERASPACCVPTKLEPITLLYHDNGVVTFNHKYEGMVVAECGCR
ncbi:bone morphogenetic protein 10 [Nothobranchius furzeri]|uniref:Bone morphogenetic protein 10 n=3 Tax=Nothobranchius TaxID=28779 RepID=A0A1A8AWS4_NOTFU|nr:bone morphogenetic protein 10-like [Nothobranchius furzeri]